VIDRLFRTKSLEQLRASADEPEHRLKKELSTLDLTMFGVGAIIGAGIFSSVGTAAAGQGDRLGAGPALIVSFVLVAIACSLTALCYAELTSMIPVSGSAYTYAFATMGELMAWIIGWDLVLEYAVSNVAVAISWGDYFRVLLAEVGIQVPPWMAIDPRTALEVSKDWVAAHGGVLPGFTERLSMLAQARGGGLPGADVFPHWDALSVAPLVGGFPVTFNMLAVVVTVLVTWLCYVGIRESARANALMVIVKMIILGGVVLLGIRFIDPSNYVPFAPNGWHGIETGAAIIFFAYIGFDAISTCAEEVKDPQSLPRGIIYSLLICTVFYIAVTAVATGMMKWSEMGTADPLALIFRQRGMTFIASIVAFGAVIATTASLLVYQVGQPRIMMSMSRDRLLGPWFSKVHPRYGTPSNATMLTGFLVALPAAFMNIGEVVELTHIGTLFAFAIACAAVLILRVKRPNAERKFAVPWAWFIAPAGVVSCLWMAWNLPSETHWRFVIWLAVGLAIYFLYGYRNSRMRTLDTTESETA